MDSLDARVNELVARFGAPDACLAQLLCDGHDPDAAAFVVVHEDFSTETLTYGELRARSEQIAAGLVELGVSSGDAVATLMGKSVEYLATVVAIWRLGAAHVPLVHRVRTAGDRHASSRAARPRSSSPIPASARSSTPSAWRAAAGGRIVHLRSEDNVELPVGDIDFRDLLSTTRRAPQAAAVGGRGAMVRMYTSGTTGRPKGVAIPVLAMATWQLYLELGLYVTEDDVFWCAADPGWAYGLFSAVLAPLAAGRTSILHEDKFTPDATWRVLAEQKVTNFAAAPTAYRALRATAPSPVVLRKASSAGEPLTPEVNEWSAAQLGISVHDHYGQTELGMVFCNHHHPALQRPLKPGSMGVPLPGWATGVLREDADDLAPPGELGSRRRRHEEQSDRLVRRLRRRARGDQGEVRR